MGIGDNIKLYRKKANFTQKGLAEKCGYATGTIQQYELGKREPRAEQLKRIAEVLNISVYELINGFPIKTDEKFDKYVDSKYALIKILESLYGRACYVDADVSNDEQLLYSSVYISLGKENDKIAISELHYNQIFEILCNTLKGMVELVGTTESEYLNDWQSELARNEYLKISTEEHCLISVKNVDSGSSRTEVIQYRADQQPVTADYLTVQAAHERTDIEHTPEGKAHDDAIMDDDSEWE